jgi:hypothetical protein
MKATMENERYRKRISFSFRHVVSMKKSRSAGSIDALKRRLLSISSERRSERPNETRKIETSMSGSLGTACVLSLGLVRTATTLVVASTRSGMSHGNGMAKPIMYA